MAKTGIKEPCIMNAEFPDKRVERNHLGSKVGWYMHALAAHQNVEFVRIKDQLVIPAIVKRVPEVEDVERVLLVHIDHRGVALGAETHQAVATRALKIDGERNA